MQRTIVPAIAALAIAIAPAVSSGQVAEHGDHDHGVARHLSHHHADGFPEFVDVFFTHHAYLERKLHPRFDTTVEDELNEYEGSAELAWQFNRWLGGEIEAPVTRLDPDIGDSHSGLGDIEVAPIVSFYQNPSSLTILSVRSGFVLPTGDEAEGLGVDGWIWEPGFLVWQGYGVDKRGAIQAELTYERLYANEGHDEEEVVFNLAWSHWLPSNWIPIAELNIVSPINEEEEEAEEGLHGARSRLTLASSGGAGGEDTITSTTLGFRYAFANGQQWGAGVQVPVSGTEAYDYRLVVGGIIHFD